MADVFKENIGIAVLAGLAGFAAGLVAKEFGPTLRPKPLFRVGLYNRHANFSGFGWPPRRLVRISIGNETIFEDGQIYVRPIRFVEEHKTNKYGEIHGAFELDVEKYRNPNSGGLPDLFFLAYCPRAKIAAEAIRRPPPDGFFQER